MGTITAAQIRKIFILSKEIGMDEDLLHAHVELLTKKSSIKLLTITEAIRVIDSLTGKRTVHNTQNKATIKQIYYIEGMAKELGWVDEQGRVEHKRIDGLCEQTAKVSSYKWLTKKGASDVIEAMKNMVKKIEAPC